MKDEPGPSEVGGEIRRIAILTTRLHPCAAYLARRLRESGAEVAVVNQVRLAIEPDSPAFYRRLVARRGILVALDSLLLFLVKKTVRAIGASRERARSPDEAAAATPTVSCMRPDPAVVAEPWVHYLEVDNINQEPDRERLRAWNPDLILLAGAPILGRKTIEVARVACINTHCGITPDYAGSSPYEWPVIDGRYDDIGYTVHLVVPKVDSGPVIWQERIAWDPSRPLRHLGPILTQRMYDRLSDIVLEMSGGKRFTVTPQHGGAVRPPAGLFLRSWAELRRMRYAARRRRSDRFA